MDYKTVKETWKQVTENFYLGNLEFVEENC